MFMHTFWIIALVIGVLFFVRWMARQSPRRVPALVADRASLEILKQRYARGEIGHEEFEQKKRDLDLG